MSKVPCQTKEKLRELAAGIVRNEVFTDRHVPPNEQGQIPIIFMPVALGAMHDVDPDDVGMIFARYRDSMPTSINGMPIFNACGFLNKEDAALVMSLAREMDAAMNGVKP